MKDIHNLGEPDFEKQHKDNPHGKPFSMKATDKHEKETTKHVGQKDRFGNADEQLHGKKAFNQYGGNTHHGGKQEYANEIYRDTEEAANTVR